MPIQFARRLTGKHRSLNANRHLGFALAFIAGATNAGSFLAVHQYTSHMTGVVSSMADNLALGQYALVWDGLAGLLSFMNGAAVSALMINYAQRRKMHSQFALPLIGEAVLLLCFGVLGARLAQIDVLFVPVTISLLCFTMGMQNAVITKISRAEIRTTHITGIVTDIGIELGKLLYWNDPAHPELPRVAANHVKLRLLATLALAFFVGGVAGALGFKHVGYASTIPLALLLILLAIVPALDDVVLWLRRGRSK